MNNNNFVEKSCRVRPSFFETLQKVEQQCEIKCFEKKDKEQSKELCLIMTEVYCLNSDSDIRIGGVMLSSEMVQEVYSKINHEHIELVIDNFKKITYEVKNKKAYLRTALYNSVFEFESHWKNKFRQDFCN